MKQIFTLMFSLCLVAGAFASSNNSYYINDDAVETALTSAVQVDLAGTDINLENMFGTASIQQDKNAFVAFALAFVIGWTGIHRVYLGGKGSLIAIYILTCGGIFGIVPFVDWIVLLIGGIKGDISAYVNNDSFFMW